MDLIYNQTKIPRKKWRYGLRSSAATGCGWIATYNALQLLGQPEAPEDLISYYQRQLPLIHGNAGTSFWGPAVFFRQRGYRVRWRVRRSRFDKLVEQSQVCLLFYWWRRGFRIGAHFVALHKTDRGIVGYNTYRNSTGPDCYGPSLERYLENRKLFFTFLIGICKK